MLWSELKEGQRVKFYYYGGSRPGYRTVLVKKVDANHLEGETEERNGEYRSYVAGHITQLALLSRAEKPKVLATIDLFTMKNKLSSVVHRNALDIMTGEQLSQLNDKFFGTGVIGRKTVFDNGKFNIVETETFADKVKKNVVVNLDKVQVGSKIVSNGSELVAALKVLFGV